MRLLNEDGSLISLQFNANGQDYEIVSDLPLKRYQLFDDLSRQAAYQQNDKGVFELANNLLQMVDAINSPSDHKTKMSDLYKYLLDTKENARLNQAKRFSTYAYIATIFIVKKGSDISEWSQYEAESDIENWNKAKIPASDFLALSLSFSERLRDDYNKMVREIEADNRIAKIISDILKSPIESGGK